MENKAVQTVYKENAIPTQRNVSVSTGLKVTCVTNDSVQVTVQTVAFVLKQVSVSVWGNILGKIVLLTTMSAPTNVPNTENASNQAANVI